MHPLSQLLATAGALGLILAHSTVIGTSPKPKALERGTCESGDCESGFGKMIWPEGQEKGVCPGTTYEGYFKNGLPDGFGKLLYPCTGVVEFGELKNGKMHGIGTLRWPSGEGYTGEFKDGEPSGTGFTHNKQGGLRIARDKGEKVLSLSSTGKVEQEGDDVYVLKPTKIGPGAEQILIPGDLDAAIKELKTMLTPEFLHKMKNGTEDGMIEYHFGLGMWMRNNWGLWHGSTLAQWFKAKGVDHPDTMSGVILDSLWRDLNGKPLELDKQLKGSAE